MDWLTNWLKGIVIIILLASFADLLLPSQKMQRYVKTVISLFILLTLLSPVFQVLQHRWDADGLISSAVAKQNIDLDGKMATLSAIRENAGKLQQEQQKEAQDIVNKQLADGMKAEIESEGQFTVDSIAAKTGFDNNGKPYIQSVAVTLHAIDGQGKRSATMKPVNPIAISIGDDGNPQSPGKNATSIPAGGRSQLDADLQQGLSRISTMLQRDYQIEAKLISIRVSDKESKF